MVCTSGILFSAGKRVVVRKVEELYGVYMGKSNMVNMVSSYGRANKGTWCWWTKYSDMNAI